MPKIAGGFTEIYQMWCQTLFFWLSSGNNEVYLATPFFDYTYLNKFLYIVLQRSRTANIRKIFVRETSANNPGYEFHRELERILPGYPTRDQNFLRENVLSNAPEMATHHGYFHAKFIGCVNIETEKAEVLLTSANFNSQSFSDFGDNVQNFETIVYHDMSANEFNTRLIQPLIRLEQHP